MNLENVVHGFHDKIFESFGRSIVNRNLYYKFVCYMFQILP